MLAVLLLPLVLSALLALLPRAVEDVFALSVVGASGAWALSTGLNRQSRLGTFGRDWPLIGAWLALVGGWLLMAPAAWAFSANSVGAVATLRSLAQQQTEFSERSLCDVDHDGTGEYGYFRELSGAAAIRRGSETPSTAGRELSAALLSGAFRMLNANGEVSRSGYLFRLFLPDADGNGIGESGDDATAATHAVDPDNAERFWCAYAWPSNHGTSGNQTLFVNQDGRITASDDPRYSGHRGGPPPGAALTAGGLDAITGPHAYKTVGQDGGTWADFVYPGSRSRYSGRSLMVAAAITFLLVRGLVAVGSWVIGRQSPE